MIALLSADEAPTTREQVSNWLKKEDDAEYEACNDVQLAVFLNNLIDDRRGKKEGVKPPLEKHLTNNNILRKLKIALDLKDDDVLALLELAEFKVSKHELSALFRKKGHKHYRVCKDQILRNFLKGMQIRYRPEN